MRNKEKEIKKLYNGKIGKGNVEADLMIIYKGPKFKDSKFLQNICQELNIDSNDIYATPVIKDNKIEKEKLLSEIYIIAPKIIWIVGNEPAKTMNINMKMEWGYGRYFPFMTNDFFCLLVPTAKMVNKMPNNIREEFWKRMKLFKNEWKQAKKQDVFPTPSEERRSDLKVIKDFIKKKGYIESEDFSKNKAFSVVYSNKINNHLFIVNSEMAKEHFKQLGFGIVLTKHQVKDMDDNQIEEICRLLDVFGGGEILEGDISFL